MLYFIWRLIWGTNSYTLAAFLHPFILPPTMWAPQLSHTHRFSHKESCEKIYPQWSEMSELTSGAVCVSSSFDLYVSLFKLTLKWTIIGNNFKSKETEFVLLQFFFLLFLIVYAITIVPIFPPLPPSSL